MGRRVALCIAMFACGCGGAGSAASLRAPIDTLVINSRKSVRLPDDLLPFRIAALASYETSPASIAHVTHAGAVACDTTGDAVVVVSTRLTRRSALLKCRPVRYFSPFGFTRMPIDGPPVRLPVANRGLDGRPVTLLAGTARVEDTTVAALRDGMIYPKALGRTRVMMDFSGLKDFVTVEVIDTITAGPVSLAGGEFRSWSLPNGRYEIWFTPPGAAHTRPISYSILNANCARGLEGPGQYHCVTYGTGAVVVRNVLEPGPRADRMGRVTIIRQGW